MASLSILNNLEVLKGVKSLKQGSLLMLETSNEMIVGNLMHADINKFKCIEVNNARDILCNFKFEIPQVIALRDIRTIQLMLNTEVEKNAWMQQDGRDKNANSNTNSDDDVDGFELTQIESRLTYSVELLTDFELKFIQKQLDGIVYIVQTDALYHRALADMRTQQLVGLLVEPSRVGRHSRPSVIVVATSLAVYIFDIFALGAVFKDFKFLLESERPRKVLHESPKTYDLLKHRLGVSLNGVYDTMVAHCLCTGVKKPIGLIQLIQKTFNFSALYFKYKNDRNSMPYDLAERPIPQKYREWLAKLAIFQLKLQERQLHQQMLAEFYEQCKDFSKCMDQ